MRAPNWVYDLRRRVFMTRLVAESYRGDLQHYAASIAAARDEPPAGPWFALSKLFIQPRRDWSKPSAPLMPGRFPYKRGELFEVAWELLCLRPQKAAQELRDCLYYGAQSFGVVWWTTLLAAVIAARLTGYPVLDGALQKYAARAAGLR
jgi:hypothetical protein